MAKVESTVKRVMARDEFPYEWDVIENEWITMSDGAAFRRVFGILRQINRFLQYLRHSRIVREMECVEEMNRCMVSLQVWDIT